LDGLQLPRILKKTHHLIASFLVRKLPNPCS
jgi:hypothetical protein